MLLQKFDNCFFFLQVVEVVNKVFKEMLLNIKLLDVEVVKQDIVIIFIVQR